ncbi:MAG: hypothetical protein PHW33_02430 [Candidatus Portnoybacteria bacterium]|jgi:hypothetical protein|nr:hypothetical protein [Candidatus Portnoybacteria bacterium]
MKKLKVSARGLKLLNKVWFCNFVLCVSSTIFFGRTFIPVVVTVLAMLGMLLFHYIALEVEIEGEKKGGKKKVSPVAGEEKAKAAIRLGMLYWQLSTTILMGGAFLLMRYVFNSISNPSQFFIFWSFYLLLTLSWHLPLFKGLMVLVPSKLREAEEIRLAKMEKIKMDRKKIKEDRANRTTYLMPGNLTKLTYIPILCPCPKD